MKRYLLANQTQRPSTRKKLGIVLAGMLLITLLSGCSTNDAPKELIQKSAISNQNIVIQYNFNFDNLKITNSYTRVIDGETVHFYDYTIDIVPKDPSNKNLEAITGGAQTLTGEVELVKRGDDWFDLTNN